MPHSLQGKTAEKRQLPPLVILIIGWLSNARESYIKTVSKKGAQNSTREFFP